MINKVEMKVHIAHVLNTAFINSVKTRTGLADVLEVKGVQVTQLLKGKRSLKLEETPMAAAYLGLPISALIAPTKGFIGDHCPICRKLAYSKRKTRL